MNDTTNFSFNFDARAIPPKQLGGAHPVGNKFPFKITNVEVASTKNNDGGMLNVEFTSDAGSIINRYGLWNNNETTRKIAQGQLSALCHAVGIFQIGPQKGKELIGGQGLMDIGFQKGHEPSADKPEGGYVELKKVYTAAGLEPGTAAPAAAGNGGFGQQVQANPGNANTGTPTGDAQSAGQQAGFAQGQQAANTAPPSNNGWGNSGNAPAQNPPWS